MKSRALLAVALTWLLAGALAAAERPPQQLHEVGGHWTAWDPPAMAPKGAEVYTVERGDTLWDLAARFYGDPYLWPQLWERNGYVLDAHWIYPGDPLVVGLEVAPIEKLAEEELAPQPGTEVAQAPPAVEAKPRLGSDARPPIPLGTEDDLYCSGYIGALDEGFGYHVVGSEYENMEPRLGGASASNLRVGYGNLGTVKLGLSTGDVVYLDGGLAGGLGVGSQFIAVAPGVEVRHPITGQVIGRLYDYLGRVRVLSVQESTAIGEVVHSCRPLGVGAGLIPFVPEPVPLGRRTAMRPVNMPASASSLADSGVILMAKDGLVSLAQDHVVFIDRGAADDVTPGDLFTIYRLNRPGLPPLPVGELAVLSVKRDTALAKIVESRYTIYVGDRLQAK